MGGFLDGNDVFYVRQLDKGLWCQIHLIGHTVVVDHDRQRERRRDRVDALDILDAGGEPRKLPLHVGVLLDAREGVAHHRNQQVDEQHVRDHHVHPQQRLAHREVHREVVDRLRLEGAEHRKGVLVRPAHTQPVQLEGVCICTAVLQRLLHRRHRVAEVVHAELLEARARQAAGVVDTVEERVDLDRRLRRRREGPLRALALRPHIGASATPAARIPQPLLCAAAAEAPTTVPPHLLLTRRPLLHLQPPTAHAI